MAEIVTLYVARDKKRTTQYDLGSVLCMQLMDLLPPGTVNVVVCDGPTPQDPTWLIGTPTLCFQNTANVYRGFDALQALQRLAVELAAESATAGVGKGQKTSGNGKTEGKNVPPPSENGDPWFPEDEEEDLEESFVPTVSARSAQSQKEEEGMFSPKLKSDDLSTYMNRRKQTQATHGPEEG